MTYKSYKYPRPARHSKAMKKCELQGVPSGKPIPSPHTRPRSSGKWYNHQGRCSMSNILPIC